MSRRDVREDREGEPDFERLGHYRRERDRDREKDREREKERERDRWNRRHGRGGRQEDDRQRRSGDWS